MEKLDGKSMNIVGQNIEQLRGLFPEVFSEGKIKFDQLQELLGNYVVQDEDHYNFTWHGKRRAGRLAQTPSTGTLRPCREESVNWDTTQNLFIEGDNLEVLKLLQKSYHRQVKMIYIDPPYNTGNDFVYRDDFRDGIKNYLEMTGQLDSEGKKMGTNSNAAGRYHTNWLNMMYPRLKLARNLLRDDGVIFISIDDNEQANLNKLCDEVFGESNLIGIISRGTGTTTGQDADKIGASLDYCLAYCKSSLFKLSGIDLSDGDISRFNHEDRKGKYSLLQMRKTGNADRREDRPSMYYPAISPEGKEVFPIGPTGYESRWRFGAETYKQYLKDEMIIWQVSRTGELAPYVKYYLEGRTKQVSNLWNDIDGNKKGSIEFRELLGGKLFDNPKPTDLLRRIIAISGANKDSVILDFFAGSGTSAHAVMQLNAEDGGKRKCISVQLPEPCDEKTEAYKSGYSDIAEISKERIRRAAKKIQEENPNYQGDLGLKVFKLDSSNIKRWEANFATLKQDLFRAVDYIKQDRSSEDVLYELLLKYGLDLTVPIEPRTIAGKTVYSIGLGALVVCLDRDITMDVVNGIGALKEELQPEIMRVVFKDDGFKDDVVKTNALQTLNSHGIKDIKSL